MSISANVSSMTASTRDLAQAAFEERVRRACHTGDFEQGATLLIEEVGPKVLAFLVQRLRSEFDAGEVFCIFSEDLWRGLARFEWRCTVRGWCFALARAAASRYRARACERPDRRLPLSAAPPSRLVQGVRERTLPYLRTEVKDRMRALFQQLPDDDRALLQLRLDQGLSFRDLAVVMGDVAEDASQADIARTAATLRKRYQLVKGRLRRMAREAGVLARIGADAQRS